MTETYNMWVTCDNCKQVVDVTIDKGTPLDQVDWDKKPCSNCGTCKLDPDTAKAPMV